MPLSTEEEARWNELKVEIEKLTKKINDYEACLTPAGILAHSDFFNPLYNILKMYEDEEKELRSKGK